MEKETFNIERYTPIEIDFTEEGYPAKARKLKPGIFQSGQRYYCLYGPDSDVGVFGSGETVLEALEDWEKNLNLRILNLAKSGQASKS